MDDELPILKGILKGIVSYHNARKKFILSPKKYTHTHTHMLHTHTSKGFLLPGLTFVLFVC